MKVERRNSRGDEGKGILKFKNRQYILKTASHFTHHIAKLFQLPSPHELIIVLTNVKREIRAKRINVHMLTLEFILFRMWSLKNELVKTMMMQQFINAFCYAYGNKMFRTMLMGVMMRVIKILLGK